IERLQDLLAIDNRGVRLAVHRQQTNRIDQLRREPWSGRRLGWRVVSVARLLAPDTPKRRAADRRAASPGGGQAAAPAPRRPCPTATHRRAARRRAPPRSGRQTEGATH